MENESFTGDKKVPLRSPLAAVEKALIQRWVGRFPPWIEGYHMTLLTIAWTAGLILFGRLARGNLHWLWLSSLMLFLQWFTDSFDGALGRLRDTGIPRWGFYMDHFLDFMFMNAIFIGYMFLVGHRSVFILIYLMIIYGAMMVSSFLAYGASGEFKITYLGTGPTEIRLFFMIVNTLLIFSGVGWFEAALPYALAVSIPLMCVIVFRTQKYIWEIDMKIKHLKDE